MIKEVPSQVSSQLPVNVAMLSEDLCSNDLFNELLIMNLMKFQRKTCLLISDSSCISAKFCNYS